MNRKIVKHLGRKVVQQCLDAGCLKKNSVNDECNVFDDPKFQWRDGRECWGLCADPEAMKAIEAAILGYSSNRAEWAVKWQYRLYHAAHVHSERTVEVES